MWGEGVCLLTIFFLCKMIKWFWYCLWKMVKGGDIHENSWLMHVDVNNRINFLARN